MLPAFRVDLLRQLHRALHIGEPHRHLLAPALEGGLRTEDQVGQVPGDVIERRPLPVDTRSYWWALQDSNLGPEEKELTISSAYKVVEVADDKPATSAQAAQFGVNERMAPHCQSRISRKGDP